MNDCLSSVCDEASILNIYMRARSGAAVYVFEHCSKLAAVYCIHCRSCGVIKCSGTMEGAHALARALEPLRANHALCARRK
eukprot:6212021-Pleurochrysis_carterae.AAC.1